MNDSLKAPDGHSAYTSRMRPRSGGREYAVTSVNWLSGRKRRRVEVCVSPTGRTVTIYVDGKKWGPTDAD